MAGLGPDLAAEATERGTGMWTDCGALLAAQKERVLANMRWPEQRTVNACVGLSN